MHIYFIFRIMTSSDFGESPVFKTQKEEKDYEKRFSKLHSMLEDVGFDKEVCN